MAYYINQKDYYFGAALSVFFTKNRDARPSLIESIKDTRFYEMVSDTCDDSFYLYMKHSENPQLDQDGSISWDYVFTDNEKRIIAKKIESGKKVYILLLCSNGAFNETVIAVLTQNEYLALNHKSAIRVKWEMCDVQRKKTFTIPNRGGKSLSIKCNRIKMKFSDIEDAV